MSTEDKKVNNSNEVFAGMTPEQIKNELIVQLTKRAKSKKNILTYTCLLYTSDAADD